MEFSAISAIVLLIAACGGQQSARPPDDLGSTHDSPPFVDTGGMGLPPGQEDYDHDGYLAIEDCDNTDPAVHPEAIEACNEIDDDCDNLVDEGDGSYVDADGDEFGNRLLTACDAPGEFVTVAVGGDCDDENSAIHPAAIDPDCDQIDQNCDGVGSEAARLADGSAWGTVQSAIEAAAHGEVVAVCSGVHLENILAPVNSEIVLISYDNDPATTYFDGGTSGRILSVEGGFFEIYGLGFVNAYVHYEGEEGEDDEKGGAIYANNTDLWVTDCHFQGNQADKGGAIYFRSQDTSTTPTERHLTIANSKFEENYAFQRGGDVSVGGDAHGMTSMTVYSSAFRYSSSQWEGGAIAMTGGITYSLTIEESTFEDVSSGQGGGCIYLNSLLRDHALEPGPIVISNSTLSGCETDGNGGAMLVASGHFDYEFPLVVDTKNVTFSGSQSAGHGAALQFEGSTFIEATVTDTIFDQQISGGGGSAIASIDEAPATIRCERCTITGGQAGFEGGAVDIDDFVTFESIDSDWGSLSSNNSPNDLVIPDYLYRNLEEHESFSCSPGAGCTIDIP